MRWRLVLRHVAILYAITIVGTAAFAVASGLLLGAFGATVPVLAVMALILLACGFGGAVLTFSRLASQEPDRPYRHAAAVVVIAYVTSYPVHVWLVGTPIEQWAPSIVALALAALVGVPLGLRIRRRRDQADAVTRGAIRPAGSPAPH